MKVFSLSFRVFARGTFFFRVVVAIAWIGALMLRNHGGYEVTVVVGRGFVGLAGSSVYG